jgi:hypothetical protein
MATKQEAARILAKLAAAFPSWKPDELTMQVYFEDLKDIPADELEEAARICRKDGGRAFAPSIGELREAWLEVCEARVFKYPAISSGPPPVYVPMPQACKDELNAFFAKKGIKSKYRFALEKEAERMMQIK